MMQDLSMHILDLGQNSLRAKASRLTIELGVWQGRDMISLVIADDGCGMDEMTLKQALDPFYTSRTSRRVGLGLPMIQALCEQCDGSFAIESTPHVGTRLQATLRKSHWDTPPLGNVGEAVAMLIQASDGVRTCFRYETDGHNFVLDSDEIQEQLGEIPVSDPAVMAWIEAYINENL